MVHILAVPGSLRARSTNKTLLEAAARLAPPGMTLTLDEGLASLPPFNPDLEGSLPPEVALWREKVRKADALVICSPEYAHGVPGTLKNALDWLVGGTEIMGKPVALFDASTRSHHAQDSLKEILSTMAARLVPEAFVAAPLLGKSLEVEDLLADERLRGEITRALGTLQAALS